MGSEMCIRDRYVEEPDDAASKYSTPEDKVPTFMQSRSEVLFDNMANLDNN